MISTLCTSTWVLIKSLSNIEIFPATLLSPQALQLCCFWHRVPTSQLFKARMYVFHKEHIFLKIILESLATNFILTQNVSNTFFFMEYIKVLLHDMEIYEFSLTVLEIHTKLAFLLFQRNLWHMEPVWIVLPWVTNLEEFWWQAEMTRKSTCGLLESLIVSW